MTRLEEIIDTARTFAGQLDANRISALERLCAATEQGLLARLRADVCPEDCHEAFVCAAAWLALSGLSGFQSANGVESFTAGTLTIRRSAGAECCLAMQAEVMMAPYLRDCAFQFRGV